MRHYLQRLWCRVILSPGTKIACPPDPEKKLHYTHLKRLFNFAFVRQLLISIMFQKYD